MVTSKSEMTIAQILPILFFSSHLQMGYKTKLIKMEKLSGIKSDRPR
jgi:hypothetical protein